MSKKGTSKRSLPLESSTRTLHRWQKIYSSQVFSVGVECSRCQKWRDVKDYEDANQVPEDWECRMTIIDGVRGSCSIPSKLTAEDFSNEEFVPGSLVWARLSSYPWWPAMVEDDPDDEEYYRESDGKDDEEYHVVFITDKPEKTRRAWLARKNLKPYVEARSLRCVKKKYIKSLELSMSKAETALSMTLSERLRNFSFAQLSQFPVAKRVRRGAAASIPKENNESANSTDSTSASVSKTVRPASTSSDKVPEIGQIIEIATTVHEVEDTLKIHVDPSPPPTEAANAVSCSVSNPPSQTNVSEDSDSEEIVREFDKDLELYADPDSPSPPRATDPLPDGITVKDFFADVLIRVSLSEDDDEALPPAPAIDHNWDARPVIEKPVLGEEDIWDINNPKYVSTGYNYMRERGGLFQQKG